MRGTTVRRALPRTPPGAGFVVALVVACMLTVGDDHGYWQRCLPLLPLNVGSESARASLKGSDMLLVASLLQLAPG
jgi:hypothetical protein